MDDEPRPPVYPQRPTSDDASLLDGLLGLVPGRLLLALFLILCGAVPYFGAAVYVAAFVGLVAFVMFMFHRSYPAKRPGDENSADKRTVDGP